MSPAIEVKGLSKRYRIGARQEPYKRLTETLVDTFSAPFRRLTRLGQKPPAEEILWALKDVSFTVQPGEVVGIIGRNGAGKSTLLKILSRITEPTAGEILLHGRVASLLEVGTGFHPELTGRENIFLNGAILGMSRAEIKSKFDEIVAFAEVERFIDTPVKRYSSGMYVRLAFAVAAHLEPEILVVDEVLAVGDAAFQKKCLGKMSEVAEGGRTVLFVSHNLNAIRHLTHQTLLLESGLTEKFGPTEEVVNFYNQQQSTATKSKIFKEEDSDQYEIQIINAKLTNKADRAETSFDVFQEIVLHISYVVHRSITGSIVNFSINNNGTTIFSSFDTDADPARLDRRTPGRHLTRIVFPLGLLKPGSYSVSLGTGVVNSRKIHHIEDALFFDVELRSKPESFVSYSPRRFGIVAAHLHWDHVQES